MTSYLSHDNAADLQAFWDSMVGPGNRVFEHVICGDFTITVAEYVMREAPGRNPRECTVPTVDLILAGHGTESYQGRERDWAPGSLLIYRPQDEYFTRKQQKPPVVCKVRASSASNEHRVLETLAPPDVQRLTAVAYRILHALGRPDTSVPLELESLCELLYGPSQVSGVEPTWGAAVTNYLHLCMDHTPTLEDVSTVAGVHRCHLARAFRAWQGCTVGEYLRRLRVHRATESLIANGSNSLAEIALSAGFYDQSHFNRTFKQVHGMPPLKFLSMVHRRFGPAADASK